MGKCISKYPTTSTSKDDLQYGESVERALGYSIKKKDLRANNKINIKCLTQNHKKPNQLYGEQDEKQHCSNCDDEFDDYKLVSEQQRHVPNAVKKQQYNIENNINNNHDNKIDNVEHDVDAQLTSNNYCNNKYINRLARSEFIVDNCQFDVNHSYNYVQTIQQQNIFKELTIEAVVIAVAEAAVKAISGSDAENDVTVNYCVCLSVDEHSNASKIYVLTNNQSNNNHNNNYNNNNNNNIYIYMDNKNNDKNQAQNSSWRPQYKVNRSHSTSSIIAVNKIPSDQMFINSKENMKNFLKNDELQKTFNLLSFKQQMPLHEKPLQEKIWNSITIIKGQAESKKHAKKHDIGGGESGMNVETKGTAMSFGFRKKLNTTPKKLKKFLESDNNNKKKEKYNNNNNNNNNKNNTRRCGENTSTDLVKTTTKQKEYDNNGNAMDEVTIINFEKMSAAAAVRASATPNVAETQQHFKHDYQLLEATRFGFRGTSIPRPTSTGISRYQQDESQTNFENNNVNIQQAGGLVSNLKRRSKSAHAGRIITSSSEEQNNVKRSNENTGTKATAPKIAQPKSITFNLNQNSTIEYQRQQFFQQPSIVQGRNSAPLTSTHQPLPQYQAIRNRPNIINTGMHTNVIVRPPPRAQSVTSYSKFTLQTVNLPKPEFAVAISVSATTPTTPGTSSFSMALGNRTAYNHPLTAVHTQPQSTCMEAKTMKQLVNNNTRRGFTGNREISADSGIASMDMAIDSYSGNRSSPKRSRSRPRNLQMVMNGRHKFEVRDLDDPLRMSVGTAEQLTLPKLPLDNQTAPLPLNGLVRSNTVLSRENYERKSNMVQVNLEKNKATRNEFLRNSSEETDSCNEDKLHLDRSSSEKRSKFRDINTNSSKTSSPGSSILLSWCNAGESLAIKDCSSMSISSNSEIYGHNKQSKDNVKRDIRKDDLQNSLISIDDDLSTADMQISTMSSITENIFLEKQNTSNLLNKNQADDNKRKHPKTLFYEQKFAEMALEGSAFLLDDETSPTDSLVSSTESEEAAIKQKKHKINAELQEKIIDELLPELDLHSPISPGTPTHASHSLSLSDCGNLIDDEIADQPALLFNINSPSHGGEDNLVGDSGDCSVCKDKVDTPTLMETGSFAGSLRKKSKALSALQQAIELSLRTPLSLRKAVMDRAESLDTLSPCGSICSDDLVMDFDMSSSVDSIDRNKSRSGSDLNMLDDATFFAELESKSSNILNGRSSLTRSHSSRNSERESVISRLPARATRLLNRSRLQCQSNSPIHKIYNKNNNNNNNNKNNNNNNYNNNSNNSTTIDSDSARYVRSGGSTSSRRSAKTASTNNNSKNKNNKTTTTSSSVRYLQQNQKQQQQHLHQNNQLQYQRTCNASQGSLDDLMLYDKSFRNAMIQDVLQFKKQLLRLRRILQETETRNPFETDGNEDFTGGNAKLLDDLDLTSLTSSTGSDDPLEELSDLRRQVVYLQSQVEDRERTIRMQQKRIDILEADHSSTQIVAKSCTNSATQTERTRTYLTGSDALSRSKTELTSYTTTHFASLGNGDSSIITQQQTQEFSNFELKQNNNNISSIKGHHLTVALAPLNQTRRHTIISTTLTNYNRMALGANTNTDNSNKNTKNTLANRRSSFAWEKPTASAASATSTTSVYKPVKITLIGEPLKHWTSSSNITFNKNNNNNNINNNNKNTISANIYDGNQEILNGNIGKQHQNAMIRNYNLKNNNNKKLQCNGSNNNGGDAANHLKSLLNTYQTAHQQQPLPLAKVEEAATTTTATSKNNNDIKNNSNNINNNNNNNNNNRSLVTSCPLNNTTVTIV